jgi:sugar lactone lactonase YvrE
MPTPRVALQGLAIGESPRWHEGRLWLANWGAQEIVAVDAEGRSESMVKVPTTLPFCFDWLPDGRMLIVSGPEGLLLRREMDGTLVQHADLNAIAPGFWNEIVVDARGHAYVNGGALACVALDGSLRKVADGFAFPNGMAIAPDGETLLVAESHGHRITAFSIEKDGSVADRRVWADLGDAAPDGICVDAEGAVWYADVPNKRCVRVREGGAVLETVEADRGCFACMLGGADRRTLYIVAAQWHGFARLGEALAAKSGQLLAVEAPIAGAGRP